MSSALAAAQLVDTPARSSRQRAALSFEPIKLLRAPAWDAALKGSPQDSIFFQDSWLSAVRTATNWPVTPIVINQGPQILAGIIGIEPKVRRAERPAGPAKYEMIPLSPYAGPWVSDSLGDQSDVLAALAAHLPTRYARIQLDLHPAWNDLRAFSRLGWRVEPRYTYVSSLSDTIEREASPAVRRRARRAARASVEFDDSVPPDEFAALWSMTCTRRAIREYVERDPLIKLLTRLIASDDCEILGARLPDGALVAANAILYDQHAAYFWLSGFDADEPHRGASNQLCHLETLRRAAQRVGRFDWLGANTPGIAEYKQSFGPRLVTYYRVSWDRQAASGPGWRQWLSDFPLLRRSRRCP